MGNIIRVHATVYEDDGGRTRRERTETTHGAYLEVIPKPEDPNYDRVRLFGEKGRRYPCLKVPTEMKVLIGNEWITGTFNPPQIEEYSDRKKRPKWRLFEALPVKVPFSSQGGEDLGIIFIAPLPLNGKLKYTVIVVEVAANYWPHLAFDGNPHIHDLFHFTNNAGGISGLYLAAYPPEKETRALRSVRMTNMRLQQPPPRGRR